MTSDPGRTAPAHSRVTTAHGETCNPLSANENPRLQKSSTKLVQIPTQHRSTRSDIDLSRAEKVVGSNTERQRWLEEMLVPGGMSPGSSSRAHARAFRFAEALMKAGYLVTEAPLGPRGGRRFTLDSYQGPRAGTIYRLKCHRSCSFDHSKADCGCFDDLSDSQLNDVAALHRKIMSGTGVRYGTDRLAANFRTHDEHTVRAAVALYLEGHTGSWADPTVEAYATLLADYDTDRLRTAVRLYAAAGGVRGGGPTVGEFLDLLTRHDLKALEVAVDLFASNGGSHRGQPALGDLITAIQAAITRDPDTAGWQGSFPQRRTEAAPHRRGSPWPQAAQGMGESALCLSA